MYLLLLLFIVVFIHIFKDFLKSYDLWANALGFAWKIKEKNDTEWKIFEQWKSVYLQNLMEKCVFIEFTWNNYPSINSLSSYLSISIKIII